MDIRQQEYQQELAKVQDRDFTHNWVSSSSFLFYLSVFALVAFIIGASIHLGTRRFHQPEVEVQPSTLYTPQYK